MSPFGISLGETVSNVRTRPFPRIPGREGGGGGVLLTTIRMTRTVWKGGWVGICADRLPNSPPSRKRIAHVFTVTSGLKQTLWSSRGVRAGCICMRPRRSQWMAQLGIITAVVALDRVPSGELESRGLTGYGSQNSATPRSLQAEPVRAAEVSQAPYHGNANDQPNQEEEPSPDEFEATMVDGNGSEPDKMDALLPLPPSVPPKPLLPCQYLVPTPKERSPARSPQAVHTAMLPYIRGKDVVEFGPRGGDALACFAQVARSATAVESAPETCRALEVRAAELTSTAGTNFSVVSFSNQHARRQCSLPHVARSRVGLPRLQLWA